MRLRLTSRSVRGDILLLADLCGWSLFSQELVACFGDVLPK
jgi:hypothetical protein